MIIRKQKDSQNPYTMINNWCLRDPMLSAKAKGIFAYIMSLPDDWRFYASELEQHFTDGRESISNGLKELEKAGYLRREAVRDNGKFKSLDYTFFETPETGFPHTALPKSANTHILNTDLNKILKDTKSTESDLGKSSPTTSSEESKIEEGEKPKKDISRAAPSCRLYEWFYERLKAQGALPTSKGGRIALHQHGKSSATAIEAQVGYEMAVKVYEWGFNNWYRVPDLSNWSALKQDYDKAKQKKKSFTPQYAI